VLDLGRRSNEVCTPLTVRSGLATGHALLFEGDDYIGSAVNMASRLCDHAKGVEALMPTMHIERLPAGVTTNSVGEVELRGFPGSIDVVELTGVPLAAESDTSDLWTRTPFI
ncbi:MAG: adenylate cyclase, partial [Ilumatobacter sp.]